MGKYSKQLYTETETTMIYELVRLHRLRIEPQDNIDDIYISSDWHLGHDQSFIWGKRGFASMTDYTNYLIEQAKEKLTGKYLILLGDNVWSRFYIDTFYEIVKKCKHVYFMNGNHGPSQWEKPLPKNMTLIDSATVLTGLPGLKYTPLTHYPVMPNGFNEFTNLCGHMHGSSGMYIYSKNSPTIIVDCGIDNSIKHEKSIVFKLRDILTESTRIRKKHLAKEITE